MKPVILAIDQGTTGSTALIIDSEMNVLGKSTHEFPQHFPQANWVEHDLNEIWESVLKSTREAVQRSGISSNQIAAIGITNQRETTCFWHKDEIGTPFCKAIVWQDRRTAATCESLKKKKLETKIYRKTGLLLDPYFSGTKIQWVLKNIPNAANLAKEGKILFGTIDSFLLYRMTGSHATDVSNASRTLLMDLKTCNWDSDLLKLFKIPKNILPQILPSCVEYGRTQRFLDIPNGTPVMGMIGDQQAALFGQACFKPGSIKCTYGTGGFVLMNTGNHIIPSKHRLLTTVAWKRNGKTTYGLEGSSFIAGAAVQWARDGLKLIRNASEIEAMAASVTDSDGVVFVPALSGMGAPYWLPEATGLFTGITRRTTQGHIARAVLEGIALQIHDLVEAMSKDLKRKIAMVKVDGGASQNNLLMQTQADLLKAELVRPKMVETTALGAALQAGLGIGIWTSEEDIAHKWKADHCFEPRTESADKKKREQLLQRWSRAMTAVKSLS